MATYQEIENQISNMLGVAGLSYPPSSFIEQLWNYAHAESPEHIPAHTGSLSTQGTTILLALAQTVIHGFARGEQLSNTRIANLGPMQLAGRSELLKHQLSELKNPVSASAWKRKYPESWQRLAPHVKNIVSAQLATIIPTRTYNVYAQAWAHTLRCSGSTLNQTSLMLTIPTTGAPQISTIRQLIQVSSQSGHPAAKSSNIDIGWIRYSIYDGTMLLEEAQSDLVASKQQFRLAGGQYRFPPHMYGALEEIYAWVDLHWEQWIDDLYALVIKTALDLKCQTIETHTYEAGLIVQDKTPPRGAFKLPHRYDFKQVHDGYQFKPIAPELAEIQTVWRLVLN